MAMDKYYFSSEIAKLINPPLHSKYKETQKDSAESLYSSRKKTPLGCCPAPTIPLNKVGQVFGAPHLKDMSAGDLIHPFENKIYQSVYSEVFNYKKLDDSMKPAGINPKELDSKGDQIKDILNYNRNLTVILPSSCTRKIDSDLRSLKENIFSDCSQSEGHAQKKAKNVFISRKAKTNRHLVEVLWNMLKVKNHESFFDLISCFKAYKKKNNHGKITATDLQNMCQKFGLSSPLYILEKLIEECDIIDKDGNLSYEEFIHSLNWKDLLPENSNFKNSKYANDWREGINNPCGDIKDHYRTTTSFIGDHRYSVCPRVAGISSSNTKDMPKLKGISEFNEYGDAASMINPNAFTKYGIFQEDLNALYTKEEIKTILTNSGILLSDAAFESVWLSVSYNGKACIGAVWSALKKQYLLQNQNKYL